MKETKKKKPVEEIQESAQEVVKAETTSRPTRGYRTYLFQFMLLAMTSGFALLTFLVKTTPSFPIDLAITQNIQSIDFLFFDEFMVLVSWPGFLPQSFLLSALVAFIIYALGLRWEAVTASVAAFLPPIINVLIKEYIRRPRPTVDLVDVFRVLDSFSFPSGHVMFYVSFFGYLWFLVFTLLKKSWRRTLLLISFSIPILFVGISRIYLGQHWASDVLGAYLLGFLILVGIITFYRWGKQRFFIHQPVAPQGTKPKK
jgi:membrane-associated phospholipid phosphatase